MAGRKPWLKYRTMGAVALDAYYASTAKPLPQEDPAAKPVRQEEAAPPQKKGRSLFGVLGAAVCTGLLILTMFGGGQVRNMDRQVAEMENVVSELETQRDSLQGQFDDMVDLDEVARQARLMGMATPQGRQTVRVTVPEPEETAAEEPRENPLALVWHAIADTAKSLMEYLQAG